jgi:hypothetical protein
MKCPTGFTEKANKCVKERDPILGMRIVAARKMSDAEYKSEYWDVDNLGERPTVLLLENGVKLYPSRDEEGNGPGSLFGVIKGKQVRL